ncbi:FAD-dependent oxidoreductase [Actinokineospora guangxiensis]|uniref:FAD-dependent oxidoreductase n=1 Tax=Actinokineospora guangxiensis TaxID=1490288 RepID=A0ABW0EII6_9PSEU
MTGAAKRFAQISTASPVKPPTRSLRRAVVLGGSMAGLTAARVLSDHADEVLVVERDESAGEGPRPGVPQGSQVHALLPAGAVQLERWFPGFVDEAVAAGAVTLPPDGARVQLWVNGDLRPNAPAERDVPVLVTTRPFLENLVRARTLALPNVTQVPGRAWGLEFSGSRVTGARYTRDGDTELVEADLVVDATGRASRLGDWLEEAGWERPPMRRMPIKLNYATALFAYDETVSDQWSVISQSGAAFTPDGRARIGGVLRVEGNRWIMLVSGYADDRPSSDPSEFRTRCKRDFPDVFGAIAEKARMLSDVVTYHQADSRRRDFHAVTRFPAGLVAVGDAVASFNPVYGQGMTSAALHASCLSHYLMSSPDHNHPATEYFQLTRVVVDAAWQLSTFADLELPHVNGPYPPAYRMIRWLSGKIFQASLTDPSVNQRLARTTTMLAHPNTLATPTTLARALWRTTVRRPSE